MEHLSLGLQKLIDNIGCGRHLSGHDQCPAKLLIGHVVYSGWAYRPLAEGKYIFLSQDKQERSGNLAQLMIW